MTENAKSAKKKTKLELFAEWAQAADVIRIGGASGNAYSTIRVKPILGQPDNTLLELLAPPAPAHRFTESAIENGGFNGESYVAFDKAGNPVMIEALKLVLVSQPKQIAPNEHERISFAEFRNRYRPLMNPFPGSEDQTIFGLGKQDLDFVIDALEKDPRTVWTMINTGEMPVICNGFLRVGRIGFFVTDDPYDGKLCTVSI